jgi:uncharacterized protein
MWINRDLENNLDPKKGLEALLLLGPRQAGKSALLMRPEFAGKGVSEVTLDDLAQRELAQRDPALFLDQFQLPLLIDEAQYAPALFSEIKKRIDLNRRRRESMPPKPWYRLTGSNLSLLENQIKESLAGRVTRRWLYPLSISEIRHFNSKTEISSILYQGGWPELYRDPELSVQDYLNDYIRAYLEKDVAQTVGIQKVREFLTVIRLSAARTAQLVNFSNLANDSGVKAPTIKEWLNTITYLGLATFLEPWHANVGLTLIKSPKFYWLDSGLCSRLIGIRDPDSIIIHPLAGFLFESLVMSEIIKTRAHRNLEFDVFFFRSKTGTEVDFILKQGEKIIALDSKLAIQGVGAEPIPGELKRVFPKLTEWGFVTYGGQKRKLSKECFQIPVSDLAEMIEQEFK